MRKIVSSSIQFANVTAVVTGYECIYHRTCGRRFRTFYGARMHMARVHGFAHGKHYFTRER